MPVRVILNDRALLLKQAGTTSRLQKTNPRRKRDLFRKNKQLFHS